MLRGTPQGNRAELKAQFVQLSQEELASAINLHLDRLWRRKDFKSEGAMYTIVFRICQDVSKVSTDQERYGQNSPCPLRPQQRRNQYIQPVLSDSGFCPSDFGSNRASEVARQTWNRPLGNCFEMPG
jgi:hypothetical protein